MAVSVSKGVIRRVGRSSRLMRSGCSSRDQGSRKRTYSGTLTTTTIITIATHTCCSGETLPPVKQRMDPGLPCVFVCVQMYVTATACVCVRTPSVYIILPKSHLTLWIWLFTPLFLPSPHPSAPHLLPPSLTVSLHIFMNFLFIMKTYAWK